MYWGVNVLFPQFSCYILPDCNGLDMTNIRALKHLFASFQLTNLLHWLFWISTFKDYMFDIHQNKWDQLLTLSQDIYVELLDFESLYPPSHVNLLSLTTCDMKISKSKLILQKCTNLNPAQTTMKISRAIMLIFSQCLHTQWPPSHNALVLTKWI